jgi:di/tricarboxylate transporter
MSFEAYFTLAVVGIMLFGLVLELLAPDVIVFSALGVLLVSGILTPQEALEGFSNKGMLTVGILFIVAYSAQSSGILEFFANRVIGRASGGRRALLRVMAPVFAMSAFLNNTPIVAMFTPTIRDWALAHKIAPSKFLIPLSYASIFGGICTLIGTSTNLVVNGLLQQETKLSISMFELAWVGIPCAAAGFLFFLLIGYRLLPERSDLSEDLLNSGREYLVEMSVPDGSLLAGKTVEGAGLRRLENLFLAEIIREGHTPVMVKPTDILKVGDRLLFSGMAEAIVQLQKTSGLVPALEMEFCDSLRQRGDGRIIEAVVSLSSPMLGKSIKEGNFRSRYDAAVLAVHRHGERIHGKLGRMVLKPGDTLLLLAGDDFYKRWNQSRDFFMISKLSKLPRVNTRKMVISLCTLFGMIALAVFGILEIFQAAVLAAMVLLLTKSLTPVEARRSIELNVLIIIASAFGLSRALDKTGAAGFMAEHLIASVQGMGPIGLLAAIYLCTSLMTEVITNNAAAALIFPIAMSSATQAGLSPMPFAIAIAVGASASFATPIGYQTNLMVYGAGGYRFSDFLKIGIPMNLIYMAVSMVVIPLVWKF